MASAPNTGYFSTLLKNKPPWGIYSAESYTETSTTLYDLTGKGRDATVSGNLPLVYSSTGNNGATGRIRYLAGNTGTFITWPSGSIPANQFTICSITRYAGSNARILSSTNATYNLIHGHWLGYRGQLLYSTWLSKYGNHYGTSTDWLVCCGSVGGATPNTVPYTAIVDGKFIGIDETTISADRTGVGVPPSTDYTLCINLYNGNQERSFFEFSQLIIWDQALTPDEMMCVSNVFNQYLDDGVYISALTRVPLYNLIANKPPWGMYSAFFSANNTLSDLTGNGKHATTTGMTYAWTNGNGAASNVNMIYGSTTSKIEWPEGSLPANFTICSLTRYTGSTNSTREHILAGKTTNVFHGHDQYRRGVACYQNGYITAQQNNGNQNDWLIMCGRTNGTSPNNILINNGIGVGTGTSSISADILVINAATVHPYSTLNSDFAFSELFIWNQELNVYEMRVVANYFQQYLNTGTDFAPDYIFNKFVSKSGFGFPLLFELPPYNMSVPTNYITYGLDAGNRALSYGQGCVIDTGFKVNGVDFGEIFQSDIVSNAVYTSTGTNGNLPSLPLWITSPSTGQPAMTVYFYSSLYLHSDLTCIIIAQTNNTGSLTIVNGNTTTLTINPFGSLEMYYSMTMSAGLNVFEIAATNNAGGNAYVNMSIYNNSSIFVYGTNTPWTTSRFRKLVISNGLKWYTYTFLSGSTKYIAYAFYAGTGTVKFRGLDQNMSWVVIGGGGGGAPGSTTGAGSGGGGGGANFGSSTMTGNGYYDVIVGSGGLGGLSPTIGGNSQFAGAYAPGGNTGSTGSGVPGGTGGVGYGAGSLYAGGNGGASGTSGAAGANGGFGSTLPTVLSFSTGSVTYTTATRVCGGGGGGAYTTTTASTGGVYGGGPGGSYLNAGKPGIVNIGGGGGGGGRVTSSNSNGGEGGDGVVLLYYTYF
jgi:hypothetical protein